jgi:predicted RNase H-like HicB family nuclease
MRLYRTQLFEERSGDKVFFVAEDPDIPYCIAQGENPQDAYDRLQEVRRDVLNHLRVSGLPVPEPPIFVSEMQPASLDVVPIGV